MDISSNLVHSNDREIIDQENTCCDGKPTEMKEIYTKLKKLKIEII